MTKAAGGCRRHDAIVVLGGPRAALHRRTAHGVRLFKAGKAGALLLTGRGRRRYIEAEVMQEQALAAGVPEACVLIEERACSTLENAIYSARIMKGCGWSSALVVTDLPHLPRALLAFRAVGIEATGSAVTGGWREESFHLWCYFVIREAVGLLWYAALILAGRHRERSG